MNNTIKKFLSIATLLVLLPVAASATPQFDPATGRYYEVIAHPEITWDEAKTEAAAAPMLLGLPAHLATITSAAEGDFVETLRSGLHPSEAWIGGFQMLPCSPEPTCGWTWENGEGTFPGTNVGPEYTNWLAGVEPNDNYGIGTENHLTIGLFDTDRTLWNDEGTLPGQGIENIGGYVLEWDTALPIANDDPGNMANSGETINIDVLANDLLKMGQEVTSIDITSPPASGGTAEQAPCDPLVHPNTESPFCVDYTSAPGFGQEDTFGYKVTSGDLVSPHEAIVTIDVDGSVSETPPGDDIVVFGGVDNGVPLLATGEFAPNGGQSTVRCCTVRDPRVKLKTFRNGRQKIIHKGRPFDIGRAMGNPHLAEGCEELPQPGDHELIVQRHFSVHTEEEDELDPDKYVFGLCVVETDVEWLGAVNLDISAVPSVGYEVDCKRTGVSNQPLTLGLTTSPPEFNAPLMRPVTAECDPRGVPKWSTWYFIPNAVHLTNKLPSKLYVLGRIFVLKLMILSMEFDPGDPVDSVLLNSVRSQVNQARNIVLGPAPADTALPILDTATVEVLAPDVNTSGIYQSTANFPNPKGELASHLTALRFAICNELAFPDVAGACRIVDAVENELPALPAP